MNNKGFLHCFLFLINSLPKTLDRCCGVWQKTEEAGARDLGSSWAPPFLSCVAFGMLLNLSELQFPHLQHGADNPNCRVLWGFHERSGTMCLAKFLAHRQCLVSAGPLPPYPEQNPSCTFQSPITPCPTGLGMVPLGDPKAQ